LKVAGFVQGLVFVSSGDSHWLEYGSDSAIHPRSEADGSLRAAEPLIRH